MTKGTITKHTHCDVTLPRAEAVSINTIIRMRSRVRRIRWRMRTGCLRKVRIGRCARCVAWVLEFGDEDGVGGGTGGWVVESVCWVVEPRPTVVTSQFVFQRHFSLRSKRLQVADQPHAQWVLCVKSFHRREVARDFRYTLPEAHRAIINLHTDRIVQTSSLESF